MITPRKRTTIILMAVGGVIYLGSMLVRDLNLIPNVRTLVRLHHDRQRDGDTIPQPSGVKDYRIT